MTVNLVLSADQEKAVRYFRKKHNAQHGTSFTANQYADFRLFDLFEGMVDPMNRERASEELTKAFLAATPAQQASVRSTLGIVDP